MNKVYMFHGRKYRFKEKDAPEGAVLIEKKKPEEKAKKPANKAKKPANKARKAATK